MFPALPSELFLRIFALLDIRQIHTFQLVSSAWNQFIKLNESVLYRALAVQHNFVSKFCSLDEAKTANPGPWMASALNWKDFCQRFHMLDRNWHACGEVSVPRERLYKSSRGIHRFTLDEKHRLVIMTLIKGGLKVFCMDTDELLFELSRAYVRNEAHCEYDNGYLIFDRDGAMEVWKFDFAPEPLAESPNNSPTDERQMQAYEEAVVLFPSAIGRGILRPHALIILPHSCHAYRFVYPTLLVGSFAGQAAFLYDIRTASLEETIPFPISSPPGQGNNQDPDLWIHYVDLSQRHIFICSHNDIVILARDHKNVAGNRKILKFPSSEQSNVYRLPSIASARAYQIAFNGCQNTRGIEEHALSPPVRTISTAPVSLRDISHRFWGVHVSPTGKSFAAITWTGLLFLVRDFERVLPSFEGSGSDKCFNDEDVTLVIQMGSPLTDLSFGDDGQVVVHSFTAFHVVLWPESAPSGPRSYPSSLVASPDSSLPAAFSDIRLFNLADFIQRNALPLISCIKVTRTGVWFDWSAKALVQHRKETKPGPNNIYGHCWDFEEDDDSSDAGEREEDYVRYMQWTCGRGRGYEHLVQEAGERDEDYEHLMREDDDEPPDVALEDPEDDDEDDIWNARRNPYSKRSLCRVDFSPRVHLATLKMNIAM